MSKMLDELRGVIAEGDTGRTLVKIKIEKAFLVNIVKKQKRINRLNAIEQSVLKSYSKMLNVLHVVEDVLKKQTLMHRHAPNDWKSIVMIGELIDLARN